MRNLGTLIGLDPGFAFLEFSLCPTWGIIQDDGVKDGGPVVVLGLGHLRLEHGAPAAAHLLQQARVPPRPAQLVRACLQDVDGGHQHSAHLLRQLRNKFRELA